MRVSTRTVKGKTDHAQYAHTAYWMQTNLYLGRLGSAEGGIEGSSPLVMSFEVLLGGVDAEVEGAACEGLAGAAELETPLAEGGSAAVWLSWEASSVKASRPISQLLLRSADIVTAWLYSRQVCFQQHRRQPRYCIAQILQASYHRTEQRHTHISCKGQVIESSPSISAAHFRIQVLKELFLLSSA